MRCTKDIDVEEGDQRIPNPSISTQFQKKQSAKKPSSELKNVAQTHSYTKKKSRISASSSTEIE